MCLFVWFGSSKNWKTKNCDIPYSLPVPFIYNLVWLQTHQILSIDSAEDIIVLETA